MCHHFYLSANQTIVGRRSQLIFYGLNKKYLDLLLKYCTKLLVISNDSIELIPALEAKTNKAFQKIGGGFI